MTVRTIKDRDPDVKLRRMQRRFQAIHNRLDRAARMRRKLRRWAYRLRLPLIFCAVLAGAMLYELLTSPWPIGVTFRHYMAARNCDAARSVGLAPALRGEPGYWPKLDRDNDGIACEPYPRFAR